MPNRSRPTIPILFSSLTLLGACGSGDPEVVRRSGDGGIEGGADAGREEYRATVRWTSHGIPHFTADDAASLAYAVGFVESRDYVCILADQFVRLRSERAKTFGAGPNDANVESDFAFLAAGVYAAAEATFDDLDEVTRDSVEAFSAGYSRYVEENAPDGLPAPCRGEDWVKPATPRDVWAYYYWFGLFGSVDPLLDYIGAAAPPGGTFALEAPPTGLRGPSNALDRDTMAYLGIPPGSMGSNGWAIGSEMSETGRGMLVSNPHFPWQGPNRLYEHHFTIPGEVDVYGVGLTGVPLVLIGFNENVAWTHTVTTANHFTVYKLDLVPGSPTTYLYDGEEREMTASDLSIEVRQSDGSVEEVTRTYYRSHYGPMLALPGLAWSETTAYTFRDANEENVDLARTFFEMNRAESLDEFEAIQEDLHGIPWANTMAVSAEGEALYFDASRTPQLSGEAEEAYRDALANDPVTGLLRNNGAVLLDGSDSAFEWEDGDPRVPGIVAYGDSPRLERADFVANANDSHWLSNPDEPLTGFSKLFGDEGTPRSPRTRMNLMMLTESGDDAMTGEDGKFSFDELSEVHFSNRASIAELLRDQVVERCEATESVEVDGATVDLTNACGALEAWDLRLDTDSRGAPLFREFLTHFTGLRDAGDLFAVGFDPEDPVATPHTLVAAPQSGPDPVLVALARASRTLETAGFDDTTTLGEMQFAERGTRRIPIHGGLNFEGAFNIVGYGGSDGTLLPGLERGETLSSSGLTREGYPITFGSSFMAVVHFAEDGPEARALLTYSQSSDPASDFYGDQTTLFSEERWRPVLFRNEDIEADPNLVEEEIVGARR